MGGGGEEGRYPLFTNTKKAEKLYSSGSRQSSFCVPASVTFSSHAVLPEDLKTLLSSVNLTSSPTVSDTTSSSPVKSRRLKRPLACAEVGRWVSMWIRA